MADFLRIACDIGLEGVPFLAECYRRFASDLKGWPRRLEEGFASRMTRASEVYSIHLETDRLGRRTSSWLGFWALTLLSMGDPGLKVPTGKLVRARFRADKALAVEFHADSDGIMHAELSRDLESLDVDDFNQKWIQ